MDVKACYISRPVPFGSHTNSNATRIYSDMKKVPISNNKILEQIIKHVPMWSSDPIIWVNQVPYKIKIIQCSSNSVYLYQIGMYKTKSNMLRYVNVRLVYLSF